MTASYDQAAAIRAFLCAHRARLGVSRAAMAARLGLRREQYYRWEAGMRHPSLPTLRRLLHSGVFTDAEQRRLLAIVFGLEETT